MIVVPEKRQNWNFNDLKKLQSKTKDLEAFIASYVKSVMQNLKTKDDEEPGYLQTLLLKSLENA